MLTRGRARTCASARGQWAKEDKVFLQPRTTYTSAVMKLQGTMLKLSYCDSVSREQVDY